MSRPLHWEAPGAIYHAERIASRCLAELGLPGPPSALEGRGRWLIEKALTATMVRKDTAVRLARVAHRLAMGHRSSVSRAQRRVRESRQLSRKLRSLERMLDIKD